MVQVSLLDLDWPSVLLEHFRRLIAHRLKGCLALGRDGRTPLWRGPTVRVAVHMGQPQVSEDPTTHREDFSGALIEQVEAILEHTRGGEVLASEVAWEKVKAAKVPLAEPLVVIGTSAAIGAVGVLPEVLAPRAPSSGGIPSLRR